MEHEFIYGIQPVLQVLLAKRRRLIRLFLHRTHLTPELTRIIELAKRENIKCEEVDKNRISQISQSTYHQGVVLETESYPYIQFEDLLKPLRAKSKGGLVLILDQIQDPQNLGAILRTAQCAGVEGVILPERGSALVNATVLKASAGGAEPLSISLVKNLARAIDELKKIPFWIYGGEAGDRPLYYDQDFRGNTAIVLGSEGKGIRKLIGEKCDFLISIPLQGTISSLNVSVAAGILLFEVLRQRKTK
jgi:23S rRNA (guanosine2251-2'-O)-methyltransferase